MPWYKHFLWPFAILYGLGVFIRNRLFDSGILKSQEFDNPIICIGNLEAGGTGKSPLVHYVAKLLSEHGYSVAVLSRGYGRKTSGFRMVESQSHVDEVGDEPLQTKIRYPQLIVAVCEKRVDGVERLLAFDSKPDVILMDDGFQHRWINPRLNILVTSSKLPYWKNHLLPVGSLREAKSESRRANALVISNSGKLSTFQGFDGQIFNTNTLENKLIQIAGNRIDELPKNAFLFSGIANADRFELSVAKNHKVLHHQKFTDHHRYTNGDLQKLMENYNSFGAAAEAVITTEKDAVRLMSSPLINEFGQTPVFYLPIDITFVGEDKEEFDKMILAYGKNA